MQISWLEPTWTMENPGTLLFLMTRFFRLLPEEQKQAFLENLSEKAP